MGTGVDMIWAFAIVRRESMGDKGEDQRTIEEEMGVSWIE